MPLESTWCGQVSTTEQGAARLDAALVSGVMHTPPRRPWKKHSAPASILCSAGATCVRAAAPSVTGVSAGVTVLSKPSEQITHSLTQKRVKLCMYGSTEIVFFLSWRHARNVSGPLLRLRLKVDLGVMATKGWLLPHVPQNWRLTARCSLAS